MKNSDVKVGQHVIYFDQFGLERNALVTNVFGMYTTTTLEDGERVSKSTYVEHPSINVIIVSPDEKREDTYGRQAERASSIQPYVQVNAWGNFWCLPCDLEEARAKCKELRNAEYVD